MAEQAVLPLARQGHGFGRVVVLIVAAVLFAYITMQAVGNFVGVTTTLHQYNAFVKGTSLVRSTPWAALVTDVLIAPVGYVVALLASRRMPLPRLALTFVLALCAVAAVWFTLAQLVEPSMTIGS